GADDYSAHVVVQFANGDTAVRPITWTDTISRVAALKAVGFTVEHNGDLVCSIEGEGCPVSNCFCADNLWAQGQWAGTAWDTTAWPPANLVDGDVIAFRNGTQPDYSDWGLTGLLPAAPTYVAASDALEWMRSQQQSDGSYDDGFGKIGASVRALIALGSAGYDPDAWGSPSLLHFLTVVSPIETAQYAASSASGAGKLTVGAAWTGQTVTDFIGLNLPISITAYYSPTTGAYGSGSGDTAWAMLGLYAAGETIPTQTIDFLEGVQNADGGWAWNEWSTDSEVQHTAACVQALLAAGEPVTATEIISAQAFIASAKNGDGGYGYQVGNASDVDTTAFVLQSLLSAGQIPTGNWCTTIRCGYLLSEQAADGSFIYYGSPSLYATQEAIPSLMHRPYGPLALWTYNCYVNYLPLGVRNSSSTP
ncbi:MAG: hypothetical protein GX601_17745, partial [Anaerolineales bacterium]|nr:hypothetical protein [Anaerolineales bacterium]